MIITASFKTVRAKVNAFFDNWLFKKQHADEKALAKFTKEVPFIHDAPTLVDRCMKALDAHVGSKSTGRKYTPGRPRRFIDSAKRSAITHGAPRNSNGRVVPRPSETFVPSNNTLPG